LIKLPPGFALLFTQDVPLYTSRILVVVLNPSSPAVGVAGRVDVVHCGNVTPFVPSMIADKIYSPYGKVAKNVVI
jgi:hypothetical protein